ncbi:MAG: sensor histidine kinase [Oscillospiraceae bacterium]|nr:sensor histidine kinase [Oscillospiraceae bacterium]
MKTFWKRWLYRGLPACGLYLACCAVFAVTFRIYGLPLGAVLYPALVCAVLWLVWALLRAARAAKKHKALSALTAALTEELLPEAETVDDEDYRQIISLLLEARRSQESDTVRRFADMTDYYTLWAHQIKTPIASMRLTLQNEDSPLSRRLTAELGRIERYVEMVMAYLRLDADSTDYVLRECELDPIVRGAVRKFSGEFIERRLELDFQPTGHRVLTDEKWLSFVLEQLLSNALKYTPEGKISIYLDQPATLCVSDTGIGIAPEDLPRVFEQGFTGYNGREDKRASGLGLYLCRRVCNNLGHGIGAESEPGKGTTVRLDLSRKTLNVE